MANHIGIYRTDASEPLDLTNPETNSWMKTHFPAIMATRPVNMSDSYQFMPSHVIATRLQEQFGMGLVEVGQQFSRARNPSGQEHFMKFRLPADIGKLRAVGDSIPEIVVMNSHNGRSTIRALAGVFRLVCSNGMVVSEKSFGNIKLRHFGESNNFAEFGKVLEAMARQLAILDARMGRMQELMLTPHEQTQLARQLMVSRVVPGWVEPADVLVSRRPEDEAAEDGKRSLWVTFNVLQENLTNKTVSRDFEGARSRSIRPLSGARAHVLGNERIWAGLDSFIEGHFPTLASEAVPTFSAAKVKSVPEAEVVPEATPAPDADVTVPEATVAPEEAAPATIRPYDTIMGLASFADLEAVTAEEIATFSKEERAKFSKRKSYLKSKAPTPELV